MSVELSQFENAARQMQTLLAELGDNQPETYGISLEWMARAQLLLNGSGALLARCGAAMAQTKTAPEVVHYRQQLEQMLQMLQYLQPKLQAQSTTLRNEHMRIKRLQGWANSVSVLK